MQVAPWDIATYNKRPFQIVDAKVWYYIFAARKQLWLFDTAGQLIMLRRV